MKYRIKPKAIYEYRCCQNCHLGKHCMVFRALNNNIDISKGILVKCPAIKNAERLIHVKVEIA